MPKIVPWESFFEPVTSLMNINFKFKRPNKWCDMRRRSVWQHSNMPLVSFNPNDFSCLEQKLYIPHSKDKKPSGMFLQRKSWTAPFSATTITYFCPKLFSLLIRSHRKSNFKNRTSFAHSTYLRKLYVTLSAITITYFCPKLFSLLIRSHRKSNFKNRTSFAHSTYLRKLYVTLSAITITYFCPKLFSLLIRSHRKSNFKNRTSLAHFTQFTWNT